jgi:molybdopterin/thiamine biosynthesis adenylyltransferase/molybdopterin synthase catalytic subunit/rhodanese-related sulfurtransferase
MVFAISADVIDVDAQKQCLTDNAAGGYVGFEGWVRNHNEGKSVMALEYEAYTPMAEKEGRKIMDEARTRFEITGARCVHRVGKLSVGEMAVWIGVTAAHRKAAFDACEYIIDAVKQRLPIWKKETYADGDSGWIHCQHGSSAHEAITESHYYDRQIRLPEMGAEGQEILKRSRILVVGAGGLGCPVLQALAGAGVGTLGICEPDRVQVSNLHRQTLFTTSDLGHNKAEVAAERLRRMNPFIHIQTHPDAFSEDNAERLFKAYDLVLDCTDNFETKYLLSDTAVKLARPLIQASIYQYEGQLRVYEPGSESFCLRCLWPEPPEVGALGTCSESGVLGATAGVFGNLQALEALKFLLNLPGRLSGQHLLMMDLLHSRLVSIRQQPNPACPLCGHLSTPSKENFKENISIEAGELEKLKRFILLDISDTKSQLSLCGAAETWWIPYQEFLENPPVLEDSQTYVLICPFGGRSAYLAKKFRQQGKRHIYSLAGGMAALSGLRKTIGKI